jgi:hypothetical protein
MGVSDKLPMATKEERGTMANFEASETCKTQVTNTTIVKSSCSTITEHNTTLCGYSLVMD